MELACPSCHTRFLVEDNAIGPDGRKVRCSNCGHVWHADPAHLALPAEVAAKTAAPAPTTAAPAAPAGVAPPPPPSSPQGARRPGTLADDEFHWPEPKEDAHDERGAAPAEDQRAAAGDLSAGATSGTTAIPSAQAGHQRGRTRRKRGSARLLLGVILLIIVALTYGLRREIVAMVPETGEFYRLAGIPAASIERDLEIADVQVFGANESGLSQIRVTGYVVNNGGGGLPVPDLEVTLFANDGSVFAQKVFRPPQPRIEPSKPARFQYDMSGEADDVARATVRLLPPGS